MAFQARNVFGTFEKRAPGTVHGLSSIFILFTLLTVHLNSCLERIKEGVFRKIVITFCFFLDL